MPATPDHDPIDVNMADLPPDRPRWTAGQRWRRVGGGLVAAVLLAVIGVNVRHAAPDEEVGRDGGPAAANALAPADTLAVADPAERDGARFDALSVQFVDRDNGFALTTTCPGGERPCSYGLAVSTDGGRSYRHRALPTAEIPPLEGYSADLHAVTARTVVIEDRGQWWVSVDAGRTWRRAPDVAARTVDTIPTAGRLHPRCAGATCDDRELTVIDPDTGLRSRVSGVPLARVNGSSESTVAPDGTRWISGTTRDGVPALAMTRDDGRTWSVSRLPEPAGLLSGPGLIVGPGSLRYAVFTVQREGAKNGFGPLYVSRDAGRTWTLVPDGGGRPASLLGAMVRPDGRLLIGTELDGPMISGDGGRTFTRAAGRPNLSHFVERGGRITALHDNGTHSASLDGGVTWSPVPVR